MCGAHCTFMHVIKICKEKNILFHSLYKNFSKKKLNKEKCYESIFIFLHSAKKSYLFPFLNTRIDWVTYISMWFCSIKITKNQCKESITVFSSLFYYLLCKKGTCQWGIFAHVKLEGGMWCDTTFLSCEIKYITAKS